tara:strand:+ start:601 stop:780 length:180 start_codon:yes stop_codon:yes gene_type:complete
MKNREPIGETNMMVLTLLTKQIDGEFTVYWKTGLRRGGELKVDLGGLGTTPSDAFHHRA